LGGKPNFQQPALVQAIIARLPERSEIVAAFDADEAGRGLVDMLHLAAAGLATARGRTDLIFDGSDFQGSPARVGRRRLEPRSADGLRRETFHAGATLESHQIRTRVAATTADAVKQILVQGDAHWSVLR